MRFYTTLNNKDDAIAYFKGFGIECEEVYGCYFALVTEEQINALSNDTAEDIKITMSWCAEGEKENYISKQEDLHV